MSRLDGLYEAEDYIELMRGVDMDPSQLATRPEEMRTNCTTRFGAQHIMTSQGNYRHVTSVFIPYGSLIFACFQTTKQVEISTRSPGGFALMTPQQEWAVPPVSDWSRSNPSMKRGREEYEYDERLSYSMQSGPRPPQSQPVPNHPTYPTPSPSTAYPLDPYSDVKSPSDGAGTRPLVRPPGDIERCRLCGLNESPEWRRSETGAKDLCNAWVL